VAAEAQEIRLLSKLYPIDLFESAKDHEDVIAPVLTKHANFRRKSNLLGIAVVAILVPGMFATVALPAYGQEQATPEGTTAAAPGDQTVYVSAAAAVSDFSRDTVKYVKPKPKPRMVTAQQFTGLVQSYGNISITGVAAIAARYLGVPYVYGGYSTKGFDCSGLVKYVYAQVGITLPHSSMAQGHMGTRVAVQDAKPGDVVVFNGGSHVGIYIGDGHMIDAPYPGRVVSIDRIYSNDYWIVHY
jgi:cell wall-associated NlpC family hydrolase